MSKIIRLKNLLLSGMLLVLGVHTPLFAENSTIKISGDLKRLSKLYEAQPLSVSQYGIRREKIEPLSLSGEITGQGRVAIKFTSKRNVTWNSEVVAPYGTFPVEEKVLLLRGELFSGRAKASTPVAALIFKDQGALKLELTFQNNRSLSRAVRSYFHLTMNVPSAGEVASAKYELQKLPQFALEKKGCGDSGESVTTAHAVTETTSDQKALSAKAAPTTLAAVTKVAQISVEGDYLYFTKNGGSSSKTSAKISGIINAAEAIYERDLGITFDVVKIHITTSSSADYSSSNASTLLQQFQYGTISKKQLGSADDYLLVSGKSFTDSSNGTQYTTIGLAYLGVVCAEPTYSYGIISKVSDAVDYITFAHEMGHTFGAEHDTTSNSLMSPVAASGQDAFSTFSKNQIAAYLAQYGSICLTAATATTTTTSSTITTTTTTPGNSGGGNTSTGGGGGGGSSGTTASGRSVAFQVSLSKAGSFSFSSSAAGTLSDSCTVKVVASTNAWFSTKQILYATTGTTTQIDFSAKITRKAKATSSKTGTKLYIRDEYSCPALGIAETTSWVAINPGTIKSKASAVTLSRWITLLKKGIAK